MSFWVRASGVVALAVCGLTLVGCDPSGLSQQDEEREPHFLAGKSRVSTMDYPGAIEAFEKALEANPHSAAAHFELGWLFDQKDSDPAAAIYHYEHFLKLRPEAGNAETVKQRIMTCKQELARNVSLGPLSERQQRDLEQMTEDNKRLTGENKRLQEELDKWRLYGLRLAAGTNAAAPVRAPASAPAAQPYAAVAAPTTRAAVTAASTNSAPALRSHTVRPGETPIGIARRYGVKLEMLMAANPRLDARRMQVGQALAIPSP